MNLPRGDTGGVKGLCLDPHDLAIAKYVARREKDTVFTRELAHRGLVSRDRLLALLNQTPVTAEMRERIRADTLRATSALLGTRGDRSGNLAKRGPASGLRVFVPTARFADRVIELAGGRVAAEG